MRISRGILLAAVIVSMAAILGVACAAPPPASAPPAPPAQPPNQSPVISNVTADPSEIVVGNSTTITAVAADPDDDPITFTWSASDGTVTGSGKQVTWTSNKAGSATINLTVSDNRGGRTTGSVTVNVLPATTTVTLNPVPSETGTVDQKNATDYSTTRAGDDANNVGYRAFWSFDISSLAGKEIQSADLKFTTERITGYPFAYNMPPLGLGGMWLWKDTYGSSLPAFDYVGAEIIGTGLMYEAPSVIDVTTDLKLPANFANNRFKVEALFNKVSNGNNFTDMIEWSSLVLEVTYANK
jgi:hypothetical protein